jgi:hypothetical protein
MMIQSLAIAFLATTSVGAFCPQHHEAFGKTYLQAKKNLWSPIATAVIGWTLASQIATASMPSSEHVMTPDLASSSQLVSVSFFPTKVEEPTREALDFSFPSYDSKATGGFGDGTEAFLQSSSSELTDPGSREAAKQVETMKRAEEARLARLAAKKEAFKAREAEDMTRALAKKKENEARTRALFGGE